MAGGQVITSGQGSLGNAIAVALVGIAIAVGQGDMLGGQHGQQITVTQGSIAAKSTTVALTGQEITTGQGAIVPQQGQLTLTGQSISVGQGTLTPVGNDVTVHISGVEATLFVGDFAIGPAALTGQSVAAATGVQTPSVAVPLVGSAMTTALGTLQPGIEADDAFIASFAGTVAYGLELPLVGQEVTAALGLLGTAPGLLGQAITPAVGDVVGSVSVPLVGQAIGTAQGVFGAPGTAALTGAESVASAGTLYTTEDRTYALVGQSIAVQDGLAVTSYLAFATGQVLSVGQEGIGPRTVDMVGQSIEVVAGAVIPPVADVTGNAGGWNHHFGNRTRTKKDIEEERVRFGVLPKPVQKALTRAAKKVVDGLDETGEELAKIESVAKAEVGLARQRWKSGYLKAAQTLVVKMLEDDEAMELAEIAEIFFNMN